MVNLIKAISSQLFMFRLDSNENSAAWGRSHAQINRTSWLGRDTWLLLAHEVITTLAIWGGEIGLQVATTISTIYGQYSIIQTCPYCPASPASHVMHYSLKWTFINTTNLAGYTLFVNFVATLFGAIEGLESCSCDYTNSRCRVSSMNSGLCRICNCLTV